MAGAVGLLALRAVAKESQRRERPERGVAAREEAAFHADDVHGEPEAGGGDAARRIRPRAVGDEAVSRVGGPQKMADGAFRESAELVGEPDRHATHLGLREHMP